MFEFVYVEQGAKQIDGRRRKRPAKPFVSEEELRPRYVALVQVESVTRVHETDCPRARSMRMGTNETLAQAAKRVGWQMFYRGES